ncbi:hypothetical protein OOOCML_33305 (plasmid) [Cupriavidus necator H16]|uniref:Uncharacterized protein n=2 Tax=Cupriavidus necator (strain ATCC 17699 / DSM 428 / KCTC 22496 / NCIMB 10442 / H16 / Stanier 337) TaxID=381666 RepID=A0AAF1D5F4_CUPNH|nr:hypothetical protein [Cupriavidus necator]QCC05444.1 hypothetical protein E6A55_33190 [Cupriavidus necator H16]QQB81268.1 hypothetical protein I6H87_33170 [Cupriavidus necator]
MLTPPSQLSLFPTPSNRAALTHALALLPLACSGTKLDRPMRAALARRYGVVPQLLQETEGGIGMRRSQFGAFLDGLAPAFGDRIGQHPNGTPLYRRYGGIEAGAIASLTYRAAPYLPARRARVLSLFNGPSGPTADVEVEEVIRGRTKICARWVSVADLHPFPVEVPA